MEFVEPATMDPDPATMVPPIMDMPLGCKFCTRCDDVLDKCENIEPELLEIKLGHFVRCHLMEDGK